MWSASTLTGTGSPSRCSMPAAPVSSPRAASQRPRTATTKRSRSLTATVVDSERAWVIEGSAGYGRGLAVALERHGEWVIEFDRPTRKTKDGAKSDALDAVRAAREMLGRKRLSRPASSRRCPRSDPCSRRDQGRSRARPNRSDQRTEGDHRDGRRVAARPTARTAHHRAGRHLCEVPRPPLQHRRRARHAQLDAIPCSPGPAARHRDRRARPRRSSCCSTRPHRNWSPSAASATSPPPSSTSPGHTRAAATAKPRSLASAAPHRCRQPPARTRPATASTEAATANSTGRSTSSRSPSGDATRRPRPTSPGASPKARPNVKPSAASSAQPARVRDGLLPELDVATRIQLAGDRRGSSCRPVSICAWRRLIGMSCVDPLLVKSFTTWREP